MENIKLSSTLTMSRIALGFWRLMDWKLSIAELEQYVEEALELGVSTFDHADIYGNSQCEAEFGKLLGIKPRLRKQMQLVTKCGIIQASSGVQGKKMNHYNTTYKHIIYSAEKSLKNFNTDYLDLLLIHRPDPLMDPEEIANAFDELKKAGKVLNFGVSNFDPIQFEGLNKFCDGKLVTNQVQFSPYCLEAFENSNIDFLIKEKIRPMAWSPLAFGKIFKPVDEKSKRISDKMNEVAKVMSTSLDQLIYTWILYHPVKFIPIVGSGKIHRLKLAVDALDIKLSREHWYEIYNASKGHNLP